MLMMVSGLTAGDAKIGGDAHFHYTFEDADNNSFNISRAYFTFAKKVNDKVAYKFQTDIGAGGPSAYTVYLKNANLSYKSDFGKFVFGLQGMNMFKIQENTWGYRFIYKTAMDKNKYSSSADLGIGWEKSFGAITPSVMLTNGTGYKKAEDDQYKKLSVRLLYGDAKLKKGFNAGAVMSMESEDYANTSGDTEKGSTMVMGAFAGMASGPFRVGGEFAMKSESMDSDKSANLISVYGKYKINKMLTGFGRMDMVEPDADTDGDGYNFLILGVDYHPGKVFHMAPNMTMKMPEEGDSHSVYQVSFRFKI